LFSKGYTQKTIITPNDLRLCLDQLGCSDSILRISKEALLNAKMVTANFSWLTIKKLIIYMGEGNYTSEIIMTSDEGNVISDETKKTYFQRLKVGTPITIEVEAYNKKGNRIFWTALSIIITE
jgi:hypothetical protein